MIIAWAYGAYAQDELYLGLLGYIGNWSLNSITGWSLVNRSTDANYNQVSRSSNADYAQVSRASNEDWTLTSREP